jgi:hypothetical protein
MNGSGTQYPPLHEASAAVSPGGTYCVGTQWAAPSVQQLGSDAGFMLGGGVSTQPPPDPDAPLLAPMDASSPA